MPLTSKMEYQHIQIVAIDLEATGLDEEDEIIQIAACTRNSSFNVYITPTRPVNPKASEITGMQMKGGYLYLHNKIVSSQPAADAFVEFLDYLRSLNSGIILVAHNGFKFGMPKIIKLAQELGHLEEFEALVNGFSDSLLMFRNVLKDRLMEKKSFSMQALVEEYLEAPTGNLHNATYDTEMLMSLLEVIGVSDEYIIQSARTIHRYFCLQARKTLQCYSNILPPWMINRIANNKIDRNTLYNIFHDAGCEGIHSLFTENVYGTPRVTEDLNLINAVCNKLKNELCQQGSAVLN